MALKWIYLSGQVCKWHCSEERAFPEIEISALNFADFQVTGAYNKAEGDLMGVIAKKFGFGLREAGTADYQELKRADVQLLMDEKAVLMEPEPEPWIGLENRATKNAQCIKCCSPQEAKQEFIEKFEGVKA